MHLPAELKHRMSLQDEKAGMEKVQSENRIQAKSSPLGNHFEQRSLTKTASKEFKVSIVCLKGKWDAQQRRVSG